MTIDREEFRRRALVEGLVGDEWRLLYETSAEFHATIEQLALWLPMMIAGVAQTCERRAGWLEARLAAVRRSDDPSALPPPAPSVIWSEP